MLFKNLQSLNDLLYKTRHCKCSDDRDRVYGLLNMINGSFPARILPDYTKTTQDVFLTVMMDRLNNLQSLSLLTLCYLRDSSPNLPTWLDCSVPPNVYQLPDGNADAGVRPQARFAGEGVLVVAGVHCSSRQSSRSWK